MLLFSNFEHTTELFHLRKSFLTKNVVSNYKLKEFFWLNIDSQY